MSRTELPVVARLYYSGVGSRRYRRASTQAGPGEPLCFVSVAEYALRQAHGEIDQLKSELSNLQTNNAEPGQSQQDKTHTNRNL